MIRRLFLTVALTGAGAAARADSLSVNADAPWEMCGECHGLEGVSAVERFPHLAGQSGGYIEKQLRDFRDGRRANDFGQMSGSVSELTEETIPLVAAYFSAQRPFAWPAPAPVAALPAFPSPPAECFSCHGPNGGGGEAPRLAGQHAGYLARQLRDFRDGRRANDPDGVMRAIAARLSDADIAATAAAFERQETPGP